KAGVRSPESSISRSPHLPTSLSPDLPIIEASRFHGYQSKRQESSGGGRRARDAARALPAAARAPLLREARVRPLPAEPHQGDEPSLARPGSDRRGVRRGDASR